jgi:hypothetical protein
VLTGISVLLAGTIAVALAVTHATRAASAATCTDLCVSVQAATGTVAPGQTASFAIQLAPASALEQVAAQISLTAGTSSPGFPAPTFTSCDAGAGTQTCTLSGLQAGQATTLQAQVAVPGSAPAGDTATLTATVTWSILGVAGTSSATASATVEVATPTPTPPVSTPPTSPSPGGSHPGSPSPGGGHTGSPSPGGGHQARPSPGRHRSGQRPGSPPGSSRLTALGLSRLPPLLATDRPAPVVNPDGLFPRIYPAPPSGADRSRRPAKAARARYRPSAVADSLPLSLRQVDAQLAGLGALALGVAMAVVRVPLRRRRIPSGDQ